MDDNNEPQSAEGERRTGVPFSIHLDQDSVVNERSGEVSKPTEYLENLRALERTVGRYDEDLLRLKSETKSVREARELSVAAMRSAIREGKVLPLLEAIEGDDDAPPDGKSAGGA